MRASAADEADALHTSSCGSSQLHTLRRLLLEPAANAAHECAEGKTLPWFACIDQCKDFGPYLLVLVVLLLLSTAIEFVFRKLDDLGAS